ncbi:hypothetical protein LR013_01925 [candidate division NPL-UPA2 bacterium]|nr:hypothetical protein [candidate division NPL-UPA2 bacterium]
MNKQKCSLTVLLSKSVPIKTLCCRDELGEWHRYRVCSVWDYSAMKFTRTPAQTNMVKDVRGQIGVKITGKHSGFVKVSVKKGVFELLFAPFNAISKKPRNKLLKQAKINLVEENGVLIGRER